MLLWISSTPCNSQYSSFHHQRHFSDVEIEYFKRRQIESNKSRGYIDRSGKEVFTAQKADLLDWRFHEGLLLVRDLDGTYEFWNKSGQPAFQKKFEYAKPFSEGLAAVRMDGKWGYIDKNGDIVIQAQFDQSQPFSEGLAAICLNKKWGFISKSGRVEIEPRFDLCLNFSEERAAASERGAVGYIDRSGRFVIPPKYNQGCCFASGVAGVTTVEGDPPFRHRIFIDRNGRTVFDYDDIVRKHSTKYVPVTAPFKIYSFRELTAGQISPPEWNSDLNDYYQFDPATLEFSEGLLPVPLGSGKALYLKPDGTVAFQLNAEYVDHFLDGIAIVSFGDINKWHHRIINHNGKTITEPKQRYSKSASGPSKSLDVAINKTSNEDENDSRALITKFNEGLCRFGIAVGIPRNKNGADISQNFIPLRKLDANTHESAADSCTQTLIIRKSQ